MENIRSVDELKAHLDEMKAEFDGLKKAGGCLRKQASVQGR